MSDRDERGTSERPSSPLLRIVNADATPEEIAALVAVFSALGSATTPAEPPRVPEWSATHRRVRVHHRHGAGGWRSSARPR